MAPTYIGNVNGESSLNGTPSRNSASYPLRYGIKLWTPAGYSWIADRIQSTFGSGLQGFNTVWLDVSSCFQYNHADPNGNPVFGWYDPGSTKLSRDTYGAAQKAKLQGLRARFPGVRFTGNSLDMNDTCSNDLLGNAYDGGVIEHYMKLDLGANWSKQIDLTFKAMANNWPAIFWVRWDYMMNGGVAAYKRFSYGNVLLAYRTTANRYQFGGTWNLAKPDDLFLWDLGAPQGTPASASELKVAGAELYRRDFANGIVLVNPSSSAVTYDLGGTFYDVSNEDADGLPSAVRSITVGARDAAILLSSGSGTGTVTDTTAPESSITAPSPGASFTGTGAISFAGGAADNVRVAAVRAAVQNTSTGLWWHTDGTWGSRQANPTTLASSAASTSWTYSWTPSGVGSYRVESEAVDASGNVETSPASVSFTVTTSGSSTPDTTAPDASVSTPRDSQTLSSFPVQMTGNATDNRGVAYVRVAIRDRSSGLWWHADGTWGSFQNLNATLGSPGGSTTSWSFTWSPSSVGSGRYGVRVAAFDAAGNVDPRPPWIRFDVRRG
jgi:hypothetical protein